MTITCDNNREEISKDGWQARFFDKIGMPFPLHSVPHRWMTVRLAR